MARAASVSLATAASALLLLSWALLSAAHPPSCGLVVSRLGPCLPYVMRLTLMPGGRCCDGVKYLGGFSEDQEARHAICQCIKGSVSPTLPVDLSLIQTLPMVCNVDVKLPAISFTVDCSTV